MLLGQNKSSPNDSIFLKYRIFGLKKIEKTIEIFDYKEYFHYNPNYLIVQFNKENDAYFYTVFHFDSGDYHLFYKMLNQNKSSSVTGSITTLPLINLNNFHHGLSNRKIRTIYLIASKDQLVSLENLFDEYKGSKRRLKKKIVGQISNELHSLQKFTTNEITALQSRLDKPHALGTTIRFRQANGTNDQQNDKSEENNVAEIVRNLQKDKDYRTKFNSYPFKTCNDKSVICEIINLSYN